MVNDKTWQMEYHQNHIQKQHTHRHDARKNTQKEEKNCKIRHMKKKRTQKNNSQINIQKSKK